MRAKTYLAVAIVLLLATAVWAAAPTGWALVISTTADQTGCNTAAASNGLCAVTATTGEQLWGWFNNGTIVEVYPQTAAPPPPPTQLAITCGTVNIGSGGLVVPTTTPCQITLLK